MHYKFIMLLCLTGVLALTGCQSGGTNIGYSRNSEVGRMIVNLDDTERQYLKNVEVYKQAMTDYEKAHGDNCGHIFFSSIVDPMQTPESRIKIYKLQGSSRGCGYQNYKVRITYADEVCHIVKTVEVLDRMTQ